MQFALPDGYNLNVEEVGSGFPLIVLHGGPGLDHSMFRPYLDPLGDEYRLLYVDERGQGRSQRVDPATLSLEVFARDVDLLAETLELDSFALLGHSFGAIIATYHAIELGTAAAYVISGGGDSSSALDADVAASLEALGDGGKAIAQSWEDEKTVETDAQFMQLLRDQLPFPLPRRAATRLRRANRPVARGSTPLRQCRLRRLRLPPEAEERRQADARHRRRVRPDDDPPRGPRPPRGNRGQRAPRRPRRGPSELRRAARGLRLGGARLPGPSRQIEAEPPRLY